MLLPSCTRGHQGTRGPAVAGGSPSPSGSRPGSAHTRTANRPQALRQDLPLTPRGHRQRRCSRSLVTRPPPQPRAMSWQRCTAPLTPLPEICPPPPTTQAREGGGGVWGVCPPAMADTAQPRQEGRRKGDQPPPPRPRAQPRRAAAQPHSQRSPTGTPARLTLVLQVEEHEQEGQRGAQAPGRGSGGHHLLLRRRRRSRQWRLRAGPNRAAAPAPPGRVVGDADWPRRARPPLLGARRRT